jgi:PAS domain S-box-containing protein
LNPLHVLIIEDSESDATLVVRQLEKAGYSVAQQRVETAGQLSAALENQGWDVIIADYQLPEFDAPAALAILQNTGLDIPFLVISGAIGEETAVSLMKSGACDYLVKGNLGRLALVVKRELSDVQVRRGRKLEHEALQESERNLKNSQSITHIGHWIMKPQSGEVIWSDEMVRIFGADPMSVEGNLNDIWRRAVHPDDLERVLAASDPANEKKGLKQIEYRVVWPDGMIRYVLAMAGESMKDARGSIVQLSGVVQDITERKLAEQALLEKMEENQRRARELETITAVSSSMRQAHSRSELVEVILQNLVALLKAQFATFAFLVGNALLFEHVVSSKPFWQKQQVPTHTRIFKEVIDTGKPITVECLDPELESELPGWIWENLPASGSFIVYPLISGQTTVGVIVLGFNHPGQLSPEQVNLVAAVAEMAGNAIHRMLAAEELENMVDRREKELEVIYQVSSAASKSLDIRQALQQALALTLAAVHLDMGGIYLLDKPDGTPGQIIFQGPGLDNPEIFEHMIPGEIVSTVIHNKQTAFAPGPRLDHQGVRSSDQNANEPFMGLPMKYQDHVVGVLVIRNPRGVGTDADELTLLSFIANHLGLVVENSRLYKTAEHSAVLQERSRLARELHDSVTQTLYSANLYSVGAQRYAAQGNYPEVDTYLTQIGQLAQQALKDMRLLVYELRISELFQNDLLGALQNRLDAVERRSAIQVAIQAEGISPLPELVGENLYRIAIEALNNSLKHARASHLWIELHQTEHQFELDIQDDGCGFEPGCSGKGGMGLTTMRERSGIIGGSLQIQTSPEKGTRIEVKIPLAMTREIAKGRPD